MKKNDFLLLESFLGDKDTARFKSIRHLHTFKPKTLISLLNEYENAFQNGKLELSEKVDGYQCSAGVYNNDLFTKTKNSKYITNINEYKAAFLKDFIQFHKMLHSIQAADIFKTYNGQENGALMFCGELLPNAHCNVIKYSDDKIGKGCWYLFDVLYMDDKEKDDIKKGNSLLVKDYERGMGILEKLVRTLNGRADGQWEFHVKKTYQSTKNKLFNPEKVNPLYDFLLQAQKDKTLETPEVSERCYQLIQDIERDFANYHEIIHPYLGGDLVEGVVLKDFSKQGAVIKIVNPDIYSDMRKQQWKYTDNLSSLKKELCVKLADMLWQNAEFLKSRKKLEIAIDTAEVRGEPPLTALYNELKRVEKTVNANTIKAFLNQSKVAVDNIAQEYKQDKEAASSDSNVKTHFVEDINNTYKLFGYLYKGNLSISLLLSFIMSLWGFADRTV